MPGWIARCDIASLLDRDDENESSADKLTIAKAVSERLASFIRGPVAAIRLDEYDRDQLEQLAEELGWAVDVEDADYILASIYDWANAHRVWLGN